jgi:tetratricopeptide (TPR) repeat protein
MINSINIHNESEPWVTRVGTHLIFFISNIILLMVVIGYPSQSQGNPPEMALSQKALLQEYVSMLKRGSGWGSGVEEDEIRNMLRKVVQSVGSMKSKPPIPDGMNELVGRAKRTIKSAQSPGDYSEVVKSFKALTYMAPWIGIHYFNLGVAQEKLGKYRDAINSFERYLIASPNAKDAQLVQERIGGLKYDIEQAPVRKARLLKEISEILAINKLPPWSTGDDYEVLEKLMAYRSDAYSRSSPNVFQMSNGKYICIYLNAKSQDGNYSGDDLVVTDVTDRRHWPLSEYLPIKVSDVDVKFTLADNQYTYNVVVKNDNQYIKVSDLGGTGAVISLSSLYQLRARMSSCSSSLMIGNNTYCFLLRGGVRHNALLFQDTIEREAQEAYSGDNNINYMESLAWHELVPTYVIAFSLAELGSGKRYSLGQSGYLLAYEGGSWKIIRQGE